VYCQECWWGDGWDEHSYGRPYDFQKPFFEQYKELQDAVPRLSLMNRNAENSEYCNYAANNKNCYLAMGGSWFNEDCSYVRYTFRSRSCSDCFGVQRGELCYEMMWGKDLYGCIHSDECFDCSDCAFSLNLRGCKNCILCNNLHNKSYFVRNQEVSPEEFKRIRDSLASYERYGDLEREFSELRKTAIHPAAVHVNCENSTGEYLRNCTNVQNGFMVTDLEDGKNLYITEESKDFMDCSCAGFNGCELYYECLNAGDGGMQNALSFNNWTSSNIYYCDTAQMCESCFGCNGVRHKKYCILNKQYSKDEYEVLLPKIIEHMQSTNEWGEFFPISLSPFPYNETLAQDYFPINKEHAEQLGYYWEENPPEDLQMEKTIDSMSLPDSIDDIPEDVLKWAIRCQESGKLFRIQKLEYDFYRLARLPLPRLHPQIRYSNRMTRKNPPRLHLGTCSKCKKSIQTSYDPHQKAIVYCEECYLKEVY
tara:strand:+ start:376 stop:1812 length:1437 start_codon:yes stop_codon:yes gene_type:complete